MGLIVAFFATAILYASVGFGGGSTYTALLALSGTDYRILPFVSLVCNVVVVSGGTLRFARAKLIPWKRTIPLICASAPLAVLGGLTPIKQPVFIAVLAASLLIAGCLLLVQRDPRQPEITQNRYPAVDVVLGGVIGYLSGLVGIGGGIFLAPLLHMMRWSSARAIAATACLFILVNSVAGLIGQGIKLDTSDTLADVLPYWPLVVAVLIGGQIGSWIGVAILSHVIIRRATGILIVYVAIQLLWKTLSN